MEGGNWHQQAVLSLPHLCHAMCKHTCTQTHTYTILKNQICQNQISEGKRKIQNARQNQIHLSSDLQEPDGRLIHMILPLSCPLAWEHRTTLRKSLHTKGTEPASNAKRFSGLSSRFSHLTSISPINFKPRSV